MLSTKLANTIDHRALLTEDSKQYLDYNFNKEDSYSSFKGPIRRALDLVLVDHYKDWVSFKIVLAVQRAVEAPDVAV